MRQKNEKIRRHGMLATWVLLCVVMCGMAAPAMGQIKLPVNDVLSNSAMRDDLDMYKEKYGEFKEHEGKIVLYAGYITLLSQLIRDRENERMDFLLNVDDLFSDNLEWQENFRKRMTVTRDNLETIRRLIGKYPRTGKLHQTYQRLVEDLDDAQHKFDQVLVDGQENLMRNAERNHLALLAERQLDRVSWNSRDLFHSIPQMREKKMDEDGVGGLLPGNLPF